MAAARGSAREKQGLHTSLLEALLADLPDGLILCDRLLTPVRASAAARWLVADGGWVGNSSGAARVQAAARAALDGAVAVALTFEHEHERWEARAAPLRHPTIAVAVIVRRVTELERQRDVVLRAAHEMKAPIHTLEGFTKLLVREAAGPLSIDQRRFLEFAVSEAGRLRTRLERLLNVVRHTDGDASGGTSQAQAPTCRVAMVSGEVTSRFSGALAAKELLIGLSVASDLVVPMPEEELGTILENLLANAIAASPRGSAIAVEARRASHGFVECRVSDSGPGIPEAALGRVFEAYYRLPGRGDPGGTGLGLTISQGLAEARGGQLMASNGPSGGATFTLTLPEVRTPAGPRPSELGLGENESLTTSSVQAAVSGGPTLAAPAAPAPPRAHNGSGVTEATTAEGSLAEST
jgi:two-component system sensor histidine kinase SenX3